MAFIFPDQMIQQFKNRKYCIQTRSNSNVNIGDCVTATYIPMQVKNKTRKNKRQRKKNLLEKKNQ